MLKGDQKYFIFKPCYNDTTDNGQFDTSYVPNIDRAQGKANGAEIWVYVLVIAGDV